MRSGLRLSRLASCQLKLGCPKTALADLACSAAIPGAVVWGRRYSTPGSNNRHSMPQISPQIATDMPALNLHLIDRQLPDDVARLQAGLEAAPGYSLAVEGKLPTPDAAIEVLNALPPGKGLVDKSVYEIALGGEPVGCLEMVRDFPDADIAFIGLLLFQERSQGRGFGPQVLRLAEAIGISWQCLALRIAVIDTNPRALAFWEREGFVELLGKPAMDFAGQAIVMQRALAATEGSEASLLVF